MFGMETTCGTASFVITVDVAALATAVVAEGIVGSVVDIDSEVKPQRRYWLSFLQMGLVLRKEKIPDDEDCSTRRAFKACDNPFVTLVSSMVCTDKTSATNINRVVGSFNDSPFDSIL